DIERVAVDRREQRQISQEWQQNLVQTGEARPGLELDAGSPEDAHAHRRSRLRRGVEGDGLADTGLAGHQQGSAAGPRGGEERADAVDLRLAPDQLTGLASGASRIVVLRCVNVAHPPPEKASLGARTVLSSAMRRGKRACVPTRVI